MYRKSLEVTVACMITEICVAFHRNAARSWWSLLLNDFAKIKIPQSQEIFAKLFIGTLCGAGVTIVLDTIFCT